MAISAVVSYVFSPNTTISSSNVNTNKSDEVNIWVGLENLTKTFAKLKVDVNPATALEVATKQYVDQYAVYRRPVLGWSTGTSITSETGLDGTSGDVVVQFSDGSKRTDSAATRVVCNMAQTAVLSGTAVSGIQSGAVANNTWYSFFAVKTTDNASNFVIVAYSIALTQANFAAINTSLGTNGWTYLGVLPAGNGISGSAVPKFVMSGNKVAFYNALAGNVQTYNGVQLATTAGATSLLYAYSTGMNLAAGASNVPNNVAIGTIICAQGASTKIDIQDNAGANNLWYLPSLTSGIQQVRIPDHPLTLGIKVVPSGSTTIDIFLSSYIDGALGVGSNPLL